MAYSRDQLFALPMRRPGDVMRLPLLGSHYPTRLSFMRILIRNMLNNDWQIRTQHFDIDDRGLGEATYVVSTPRDTFSFVVFSHDLDDDIRNDRVIDGRWDLTATLCSGEVSTAHRTQLRQQVPLQEAGRLDRRSLVLTRANRSSRSYRHVVNALAEGQQPSAAHLASVGYLYRTTAVYGSGKFGMIDWSALKREHPDLARPFMAEMLTCYLIRTFSIDLAEHVAQRRAPQRAVSLAEPLRRYLGIGNATGLGMAPFLICHPLLINQWITVRETALARVRSRGTIDAQTTRRLTALLQRAQIHLLEGDGVTTEQRQLNQTVANELNALIDRAASYHAPDWEPLINASASCSLDTQDVVISCLLELYPDLVDDLADNMCSVEAFDVRPEQSLAALKTTLEQHYDWALSIDFDEPSNEEIFWYRSREEMEPRLGNRRTDPGIERQMNVDIGRQAHELYEYVCDHLARHPDDRVAHFLIRFPALRYIVRRVQTMATTAFGEIRANLLAADVAPTQLMRCKLSFFGASRFDPQSRLWVRNTMFQGAPTPCDMSALAQLGSDAQAARIKQLDDWSFPLLPDRVDAHDALQ